MTMKNFTSAAKEVATEGEEEEDFSITFGIDGEPFTATLPTADQLALYSASFSEDASTADVMRGTLVFTKALLGDVQYKKIVHKIGNEKDPFTLDSLQEILAYLFEEATDHPTRLASGSSRQQPTGGQRSTARSQPKASTRSRSRAVGSAT